MTLCCSLPSPMRRLPSNHGSAWPARMDEDCLLGHCLRVLGLKHFESNSEKISGLALKSRFTQNSRQYCRGAGRSGLLFLVR